jgi:hypothetical protein
MKKVRWYTYQTNYANYCVVDDGHTVSTSTVSHDDKFSLNKGLGVAILRSRLGINHPVFKGYPLTKEICSGMVCVDEKRIGLLVSLVKTLMKINKSLSGKNKAWKMLDRFGSLVKPENNFTRLTSSLNL